MSSVRVVESTQGTARLQKLSLPLSRDMRVDFFRGLALLVIAVNHAEELSRKHLVSTVTYAPIGISTAAEVFIFLSGFALGIAYYNTIVERGFLTLHARCLVRASQLYMMHLLCLALTVAAITWIPWFYGVGADELHVASRIQVSNLMMAKFATLMVHPTFLDILPLYIVLLCVNATAIRSLTAFAALGPFYCMCDLLRRAALRGDRSHNAAAIC